VASPETPPSPETGPAPAGLAPREVVAKAADVRSKVRALQRLAHEVQVREALTRTELTLALHDSLSARAELAARLRAQALAAHAVGRRISQRRAGRAARLIDGLLLRLGSFGQALIIARAGVWRPSGRPLHDLRHMAAYARRKANPGIVPLAPLDQAWYLATYRDVAASRMAPLVHYLTTGVREGRAPHGLFDVGWYARQHAHALAATGVSPLEHYVRSGHGAQGGTHPLFDVGHYLAQTGPLEVTDDPLAHYLREGWRSGASPHPLFDPAWYLRQAPEAADGPPLLHYLSDGWRAGRSPHPLFDPAWYLAQNGDVAEAGVEPLTHFLAEGGAEGRDPGPWFDTRRYMEARGADLAAGVNPLLDYLQGGAWAVAEAKPGFPTAAYLAKWPELARAGVTPLEHWARRSAG
jgi:hypothetical protein